MPPVSWFRAFRRDEAEQLVDVLCDGDAPAPPELETDTAQLELHLQIDNPCVYFYVGRTHTSFGRVAMQLSDIGEKGTVSPFDTGGLVRKIQPVAGWQPQRQVEYLTDYSWSLTDLASLFSEYPGDADADVVPYLDPAHVPKEPGPHVIWQGRNPADIWRPPNEWRAWTWEARVPTAVPTTDSLEAWTCEPALADEVFDCIDQLPSEQGDWLVDRFVDGGVGELVRAYRDRWAP